MQPPCAASSPPSGGPLLRRAGALRAAAPKVGRAAKVRKGQGDQGPWGTCAVYAVCGAIHDYLKDYYDIKLGPVDHIATLLEAITAKVSRGGIRPDAVMDALNSKMAEGFISDRKFMFVTPAPEHRRVVFKIKYRAFSDAAAMAKSGIVRYGVVWGQGKRNEQHSSHAMQGSSYTKKTDGKCVIHCSNSWGTEFFGLCAHARDVPGSEYPDFTSGHLITLEDVRVKDASESEWYYAEPTFSGIKKDIFGFHAVGGKGKLQAHAVALAHEVKSRTGIFSAEHSRDLFKGMLDKVQGKLEGGGGGMGLIVGGLGALGLLAAACWSGDKNED